MSNQHAFIVYAGPGEPGRVFHALVHAKQAHARGDGVLFYFAAEGTAWPGLLAQADHPMHALYQEVASTGVIQGACRNCAAAFGNTESAGATCGLIDGPAASAGQIDILGLDDAGYRVWLF